MVRGMCVQYLCNDNMFICFYECQTDRFFYAVSDIDIQAGLKKPVLCSGRDVSFSF